MTHGEFKAKLKEINLDQRKFAQITDYGYSTVKGWKTIPKWAILVLSYIELMHNLKGVDVAANVIDELKIKVQKLDTILQEVG